MMKVQARALKEIKEIADKRYVVQDGKFDAGYHVRWSFDSITEAYRHYESINTGRAFKKRLVDTKTGEILERYLS